MIPSKGNHTQKIPPITSVSDKRVRSAAGKYFALAEYIIRAEQTKNPCNDESEVFFKDIKISLSLKSKTKREAEAAKLWSISQKRSARALATNKTQYKATQTEGAPSTEVRTQEEELST